MPSVSGIAGNDWYDREEGRHVTSVSDSHTQLVGGNGGEGASPHRLLVSTIGDELKMADGGKSRVGGPIWAIFDSGAVAREKWDPKQPNVDPDGHFFSGDTLAELAGKIQNKYQVRPMPAAALQETVARYNTFVDFGRDDDFKKPAPAHKILTPPFYAAWSTPILHDSLAGIRVNAKYQVVDHHAHVIPGLYCVGESASGFAMHGLAKCLVSGFIAGREAAKEA